MHNMRGWNPKQFVDYYMCLVHYMPQGEWKHNLVVNCFVQEMGANPILLQIVGVLLIGNCQWLHVDKPLHCFLVVFVLVGPNMFHRICINKSVNIVVKALQEWL